MLSEATSLSRMIPVPAHSRSGPPHRSQVGEKLLELAVVEHTVRGEGLGARDGGRAFEQLVGRGHRAPPGGVVSAVSGHNVTSKVGCFTWSPRHPPGRA